MISPVSSVSFMIRSSFSVSSGSRLLSSSQPATCAVTITSLVSVSSIGLIFGGGSGLGGGSGGVGAIASAQCPHRYAALAQQFSCFTWDFVRSAGIPGNSVVVVAGIFRCLLAAAWSLQGNATRVPRRPSAKFADLGPGSAAVVQQCAAGRRGGRRVARAGVGVRVDQRERGVLAVG